MKVKDKDAKRTLTIAELEAELRSTQEKQFKLQFKHRVMPVPNPADIQNLRRHIARLKTWIREKQLADAKK